jgi:hypothetical protein
MEIGLRSETDALDKAIIFATKTVEGGLPVQRIAEKVGRAYNTVLVRCLKLQAVGLLGSEWYGNVRKFYAT